MSGSRGTDRTPVPSNICVLGTFASCIGWFVVEDAEMWKEDMELRLHSGSTMIS